VPSGGATLVVVNLRAQLLSLYRGGYEIGRARIIYGADEKPTPTGTFPILAKDAVHFSSIYGGAPMPFTLRLTHDGVSIHGSEIAEDLVTHGCVGLPRKFAAMLFGQVKVGDRVVIWRG
jgi:lipoprotein-anchoring transpeptidase ErfK/SrfK